LQRVNSSPKHTTVQQFLLHFKRTLESQVTAKVLNRILGFQQRRRDFFIRLFVVGGPKKISAVLLCTVVGPTTFGPLLAAYPTPLVVALWVAARHVVATVRFQNGQIASGALPRVLLHPFFTQPVQCLLV